MLCGGHDRRLGRARALSGVRRRLSQSCLATETQQRTQYRWNHSGLNMYCLADRAGAVSLPMAWSALHLPSAKPPARAQTRFPKMQASSSATAV